MHLDGKCVLFREVESSGLHRGSTECIHVHNVYTLRMQSLHCRTPSITKNSYTLDNESSMS